MRGGQRGSVHERVLGEVRANGRGHLVERRAQALGDLALALVPREAALVLQRCHVAPQRPAQLHLRVHVAAVVQPELF